MARDVPRPADDAATTQSVMKLLGPVTLAKLVSCVPFVTVRIKKLVILQKVIIAIPCSRTVVAHLDKYFIIPTNSLSSALIKKPDIKADM